MTDQLEELRRIAEFDHVFTVTPDGAVVDGPAGIYAPECYHDESTDIDLAGAEREWDALTGYTGQYSYSGAVMHSSESLGGRLARDILETPGAYVVVVVSVLPEWREATAAESESWRSGYVFREDFRETDNGLEVWESDPEPAGWAILRQARQCVYVVDGTDTDGTVWHRCVTHDELAPSADAQCAMAASGAGSAGLVSA